MIDATDARILSILQADARTPNAKIARQVGLAPSAVFERIKKLEARGLVRGYEALLDARQLGLGLTAFVFVRAEDRVGEETTGARIGAIPGVQEVHHVAGEDCFLVKVRAPDTESLGRLLREGFGAIDTVRSTRTTIVLSTVKETGRLPIPGVAND